MVLPTLRAGGAERVATTLLNYWAEQGRDVAIATFEPASEAPYYTLHARISVLNLDLPSRPTPAWRSATRIGRRILKVRRAIKEHQPDIVLSFLTKANVIAILAATGLGVPVVVSERNNPYLQTFGPFWSAARSFAYPRAGALVSITKGALEFYPPRQRPNARIIPNPVRTPTEWVDRRNGRTVTAVGRLDKQKRFDRLLDAFARVAGEFPDWRLVIWGEGKERRALEDQIRRLGLTRRVEMPGVTRAPGLWVETADFLVLTSDFEGWANVIAEAMCAGVPVVSVDCEFGPKELLYGEFLGAGPVEEPAGVIVPKHDVAALSTALASFMRDPDLRGRFGRRGADYAKALTVESIAAEWDALFDDIIRNKRR